MEKEQLVKFLSCLVAIVNDGQLVIKNKNAVVSHTDSANIAMVYCQTPFDIIDGTFGVEFDRMLSAIKTAKSKTVDIILEQSTGAIKYDKTKHNFSLLNVKTLQPIRPKIEKEYPCIIEFSKEEFNDIITVAATTINIQKNEIANILLSYDKDCLKFRAEETKTNYVEREVTVISTEKGMGNTYMCNYPMYYIVAISDALKKLNTESIQICFGNAMPIMIKAKDEDIEVEYFVAERND